MFMLTEKRAVQWPHLTVTTMDKLLHGTLTCVLDRYENKKPEEKYGKRRYIYIYIYSAETRELAVTITSNMVVQKPHCT